MLFTLAGFTQDIGFRLFSFERVAADRSRTVVTVRADLALARRYGIRVQELPLLCRGLLERCEGDEQNGHLTFTEDEMRVYANNCATAKEVAAANKKAPRRPTGQQAGAAWRAPQL